MKSEKKYMPKGLKTFLITASFLILLSIFSAAVYCMMVCGLPFGKIIPNVYVAGINVGGMTFSQALATVNAATDSTYGKTPMTISVRDLDLVLPADIITAAPDMEPAVREAYAYGRTGLPSRRRQQKAAAQEKGYHVNLFSYMTADTNRIHKLVSEFSLNFPADVKESTWEIAGDEPDLTQDAPKTQTLIIKIGAPGFSFDADKLEELILNAYNSNRFSFPFTCPMQEPAPVDIKEIYSRYSKKPQNAVIDPETFEVQSHINGYDFYLKSAENQLYRAQYGDTVEIPFRIIPAEIKYEDLASILFRDVLSTFTANAGSSENRDVNLKLSCEAINGKVLMPGEVFDYNETLGERTAEKGYRPAGAYDGNKTVNSYGGGICQASSCLYYTALMADLDIVTRVNHGFVSSYMPIGMDATVSWGGPEFRFRNSTDYPIRIEAKADGGSVTVTLVGTDTKDYYVKMESKVLEKEKYKEVLKELPPDNSDGYKDGDVINTPYTGYTVATYRCKYDRKTDELISREHETTSHYSKRDKEICKIVYPDTVPPAVSPGQ